MGNLTAFSYGMDGIGMMIDDNCRNDGISQCHLPVLIFGLHMLKINYMGNGMYIFTLVYGIGIDDDDNCREGMGNPSVIFEGGVDNIWNSSLN